MSCLLLGGMMSVQAQVDRSKMPEPGPAPVINIENPDSFTLENGLTVFVVENDKLPTVAISLIIDRDPILEGDMAGYVSMAGQLMRNGTTSRTKEELDREVDFIGASLNTGSTGVFGSSLKRHVETLAELMADVVMNPAFPEEELEKLRKQTLSGLAQSKEDANAIASNVAQALTYGVKHPYGEQVTEETVENITLDKIREYYNTYFKPNIAYMAVVGDINTKEAKKLIEEHFGNWQQGEVPEQTFEQPAMPDEVIIAMVDRPQAVQSVINVTYPVVLAPNDPDLIKTRVMNQILGGAFSSRLNMNLRETHGYTYGARSSLSDDKVIGRFSASASVRNEVTDSAVAEFMHELKDIRANNITDEELDLARNYLSGSFARSLESAQTKASFAINTAVEDLPEDYYANYLKNLAAVTADDVTAMANEYVQPGTAYVVVVGKASEVAPKLEQFGTLKYYDVYGNEVDPSKAAVPEGLTASQVIDDYLKAIGGKDALNGIETMKMTYTGDVMGQTLKVVQTKKVPGKLLIETMVGGNVMSRQLFNEGEASMSQMGNNMPVTEDMKASLKAEAYPVSEMGYVENGFELELQGVEKIDGKDAYAVAVTDPAGETTVNYYEVESGLKVQSTRVLPQGQTMSTSIGDYKEVNGVLIPHTLSIPLNPQVKANLTVEEVSINEPVDDSVFN